MRRFTTRTLAAVECDRRSMALRHYPSRQQYLRALVSRLHHVPQIFPVAFRASARTRADHCRNMAHIVSAVAFGEKGRQEKRHLVMAAMLHDVGHGLHGHATEQAIRERFGNHAYSNDRQSARWMYFLPLPGEDCVAVFSTAPIEPLRDIGDVSTANVPGGGSSKSRWLDFLDDLENAVGDAGDLARNGWADPRELGGALNLAPTFALDETAMAALDLLRRFGFDGRASTLWPLARADSELSRLLSTTRARIDCCRRHIPEIDSADAQARSETLALCDELAGLHPERSADWLIDVVTSLNPTDE